MKNNIKDFLLWVFPCFILLYVSIVLFYINTDSSYIWACAFFVNLLVCIRFRNHIPLLIISVFMLSYTTVFKYYFIYDMNLTAWPDYQNAYLFNKVILLQTIFIVFFFSFTYDLKERLLSNFQTVATPNNKAFWFVFLIAVLALIFGMTGDSLLSSGYGEASKVKTPLFEYFIAIYISLLLTVNKSQRFEVISLRLLLVIFCLKSLLYGARVEVLQICLLYGFYEFNFFRDLNKKNIFIFGGLLYLCLEIMGAIRGEPQLLLKIFNSWNDFYTILFHLDYSRPYISGNQGDVVQASSRLIGLLEDGYISLEHRIISFSSFILNVFLYFGQFKNEQNLASLSQNISRAGGGGLISTYFYIWLGYLGPGLIGAFIGFIIRKIHKKINVLCFIYVTLLLISFPRWFAYGPIVLVKFCIIGAVFYFFIIKIFGKTRAITF